MLPWSLQMTLKSYNNLSVTGLLIRQHLEAGTWAQLLEQNQVQSYLQHHCPICTQWAATPAGIKCHMTHHHADWTDLQASIRAVLRGFRRHTTVPCRYCHNRQINKDRHWLHAVSRARPVRLPQVPP